MGNLIFGVALALVVVLYSVLIRHGTVSDNPKNPPSVPSKIPFIGHVLGLIYYGGAYYTKLSTAYPLPIYAMPLLKSKMYVVNSLALISAIGKHSKNISFIPFVKIAAERLSGLDPATLERFDPHGDSPGVALETVQRVEHALLSSSEATELDLRMLEHLEESFTELQSLPHRPRKFLAWIQHVITQASSRAIYGPLNPLLENDVEEAFWTFEHNLGLLLLNFAPGIFKKKAIIAREKVAQSFLNYYKQRGHDQGSPLARARHNAPAKYGLSEKEIACLEVPFNFAVLNNTVPTAFWVLSHVYSRPELLADLRVEISHTVKRKKSGSQTAYTINIASLKRECPLLLAIFHEILRTYSVRPNIRQVIEDTVLNDQYLLEKGAIVQMSTKFVHTDPAVWGSDAKQMDLRRFLRNEQRKPHAAAFGTFGVAPHVCPGRHFATTEILAMTARLVMQWDIEPVGKVWKIPEQNKNGFSGVTGPLCDIEVVMRERVGWQGHWGFALGESNLNFALASG